MVAMMVVHVALLGILPATTFFATPLECLECASCPVETNKRVRKQNRFPRNCETVMKGGMEFVDRVPFLWVSFWLIIMVLALGQCSA